MQSLIRCTQVLLILLSAFGFYSTIYLAYNNGTVAMLAKIPDYGPHLLPGTNVPLKQSFTGIGAIDHQLTVLVTFFWPIVDGSLPNASLFCFMFAGEAVAAWTLIYAESQRLSHSWRLVSFAVTWGLAIQMGTFAVFMPIHLAIHLSTSPTVSSRKAADFAVDIPQMLSLPWSLVFGFLVPAVALALPAPSILTYGQKQTWLAAWQAFPAWMEISQQSLSLIVPMLWGTRLPAARDRKGSNAHSIRALRTAYIFAMVFAGVTRIATISISLTSKLFPAIFAPEFRGVLDPSNIFLPASLTPSKKMTFAGEGALQLLQYDEICGALALVIWSAVLLVKKYSEIHSFNFRAALKLLGAATGLIALFGPSGCAAAFLWARDELVFDGSAIEEKKSM